MLQCPAGDAPAFSGGSDTRSRFFDFRDSSLYIGLAIGFRTSHFAGLHGDLDVFGKENKYACVLKKLCFGGCKWGYVQMGVI